LFDTSACRSFVAIPNNQEFAGDLAEQKLGKASGLFAAVGMILHRHEAADIGVAGDYA
jgi:hypothetical protein